MTTSIAPVSQGYQSERRSWHIVQPGGVGYGYTPSGTLDVSAFTPVTHYPNGYFLSGIALGVFASGASQGLYGPYLDTATDGRQVCAGYLFASIQVPNLADLTVDCPCAVLTGFAVVKVSKLPIANAATGGGFIDAAGQADLKLILHIP